MQLYIEGVVRHTIVAKREQERRMREMSEVEE